MIIGFGVDMVDIRRIESMLENHAERFEQKVFSDAEQEKSRASSQPAASYAKRYAAKEACAKALGTGFRDGLFLQHIAVENDGYGAPSLVLSGAAAERLEAITPLGKTAKLHVSLTDEPPYALAQVIISAD